MRMSSTMKWGVVLLILTLAFSLSAFAGTDCGKGDSYHNDKGHSNPPCQNHQGGNPGGNGGNGGNGGDGGQGGDGGTGIGVGGDASNTNTITNTLSNRQAQVQGQQQSISDSGNSTSTSSVSNSGNSSATSSASNNGNGNGNGSNNTSITTEYKAAKIPVATAYAPTAFPTANCAMGYSGGAQGILTGATGGFTRIDKTCQQLEVARSFAISGARKAYCQVMIQTKWAKKANVKLEDCMLQEAPPAAVPAPTPQATVTPAVPVTPAVGVPVIVNPPSADPVPAPVQQKQFVPSKQLIGVCTFGANSSLCTLPGGIASIVGSANVTPVCTKMLDEVVRRLKGDPKATLVVKGTANRSESPSLSLRRAESVKAYLTQHGVNPTRLTVEDAKVGARTTELWLNTEVEVSK